MRQPSVASQLLSLSFDGIFWPIIEYLSFYIHNYHPFFRQKIWALAADRKDLIQKEPLHVNKNYRLCSLHFEDHMFMNIQERLVSDLFVIILYMRYPILVIVHIDIGLNVRRQLLKHNSVFQLAL